MRPGAVVGGCRHAALPGPGTAEQVPPPSPAKNRIPHTPAGSIPTPPRVGRPGGRPAHLFHVLHREVEALRRRRLRPPLHGCGGASGGGGGGGSGRATAAAHGQPHRGGTRLPAPTRAAAGRLGSVRRGGQRRWGRDAPPGTPRAAAPPPRSAPAPPRPAAPQARPDSPGPAAAPHAGRRSPGPKRVPCRPPGTQRPPGSPRVAPLSTASRRRHTGGKHAGHPRPSVYPPSSSRGHAGVGHAAHRFIATGKRRLYKNRVYPSNFTNNRKKGGWGHGAPGAAQGFTAALGLNYTRPPGAQSHK